MRKTRLLVVFGLVSLALVSCKTKARGYGFHPPGILQATTISQIKGKAGLVKTGQYEVKVLARGFYKHLHVVLEYDFTLGPNKPLPFPETEVRVRTSEDARVPISRAVITPLRSKNRNHRSKLVFKVGKPFSSFVLELPSGKKGKKPVKLKFTAVAEQYSPIAREYRKIKTTRPFLLESDSKYY